VSEATHHDEEYLARHLIGAIYASAVELRTHNRKPVRVRMHPLDAETIACGLFGPEGAAAVSRGGDLFVLDLSVAQDEAVRLGEPVAEFDP
jgi:hypothetical protein